MQRNVYTIGYAGLNIEKFVEALKSYKVTKLVDVRSTPRSQYFPNYNDMALGKTLSANGIKYANWKHEFGARQEGMEFITNGIVDFEKFSKSEQFKLGLNKIEQLAESGEVVCLMCAEIDPVGCHRAILCGRGLHDAQFNVQHIIGKRSGEAFLESHGDLEQRLVKLNCKQLSLLGDDLVIAYKKQNERIGYKPKGG